MNIFDYLLDPSTWLGPGKTLDLLLEHLAYTARRRRHRRR